MDHARTRVVTSTPLLVRTRYDMTDLAAGEELDVVLDDEIDLRDAWWSELAVRVYDADVPGGGADGWVDVRLEGLAPSPEPTTDVYSVGTIARVRLADVAAGDLVRTALGWDVPGFARLHLVMHRSSSGASEFVDLAVDLRRFFFSAGRSHG